MHTQAVRLALLTSLVGASVAGVAHAQSVISAQSGTVHYIEGAVYVGGKPVQQKFGQFPAVKAGEELETKDGRAEVLLTPGAFLRLAENSSVRMLSTQLSDTRVEVLSGSVMVECDQLLPSNSLALTYHGENVRLEKSGLYRLDADRAYFGVYNGEAVIHDDSSQVTLKGGKEANLNGVLQAESFDTKLTDSFYDWSKERSAYLAYASVSAGQSLRSNGFTSGGLAWGGGWGFSPLLDEFTFIPGTGVLLSPFGWQFWSPYTLGYYPYIAPYYYAPYVGVGMPYAGSGLVGSGRNGVVANAGTRPTNANGPVHPGTPRTSGLAGFAHLRGNTSTGFVASSRSGFGSSSSSSSGFSAAPSSGSRGDGFGGGGFSSGSGGGFGGGHSGGGGHR
jgi:hypothetical protein